MADQVRMFVSHHHSPDEDKFTARLVTDLEAAGADVWVDDARITSDDFIEKINAGLVGRQWLVLVMTPDALRSQWVRAEVNAALNQMRKGRMLGVIPIIAQPCDDVDIPPLLDALHRYDATLGYESARDGVLRALGLTLTMATSVSLQSGIGTGTSTGPEPLIAQMHMLGSQGSYEFRVLEGQFFRLYKNGQIVRDYPPGHYVWEDQDPAAEYVVYKVDARVHLTGVIVARGNVLGDLGAPPAQVEFPFQLSFQMSNIDTLLHTTEPLRQLEAIALNRFAVELGNLSDSPPGKWVTTLRVEMEAWLRANSVAHTGLQVFSVLVANRPQ